MARASTSRSQNPRASQKHPRPSQAQRPRRSRADEDPDEEDDAEGEDEDDDDAGMDVDVNEGEQRGNSDNDLVRKANDLVRLALFTEHKRNALRREDISKKVLGSNTRSFNTVFEIAQKILRKTFGMELIELRSRAELDKATNGNNNEDEPNEARTATGVMKKTTVTGSKTYMLRSILDPVIIEYAVLTYEEILEDEAADEPSDDDDDLASSRTYGSIISWSKADQLGPTGVLYTILALILVSGRAISDMDFRRNLRRLRLPGNAFLTFNARSTHKSMSVDTYLTHLIRQGYIDKQRIGDAKAKGKGAGKRGRAIQGDDEAGTTYEWRWGGRAQAEVGEMAIARFIAEFMVGESEEDGDDEGDGRVAARARGAEARARLEKMLKGIERAAGGTLSDLM